MATSTTGATTMSLNPNGVLFSSHSPSADSGGFDSEEYLERPAPLLVLVVGKTSLEDALLDAVGLAGPCSTPIEVERVENTDLALGTAKVYAPDVLLLDGDALGGEALVRRLRQEPLTANIPVVVMTPTSVGELTRWKELGVGRIVSRWAPAEALYRACVEEGSSPSRLAPKPIGEVTIEELQKRLTEALQIGLTDAVKEDQRKIKVALGDGRDITNAMWIALSQIRNQVTARAKGAVRFIPTGATATLSLSTGTRSSGRGEKPDLTAPLEGCTILVADDDPAVRWFMRDVLEEAGAHVIEAADGDSALVEAFKHSPHAILADIQMPRLDGFSLCRAIKRDPLLRDSAVILLSWREDWLYRLQELNAGADGYMRKEASVPLILQQLGESLRPRVRLMDRLRSGGDIEGRLDGMTSWTLLTMLREQRPDVQLRIDDAAHTFDVELRDGFIVRIVRMTADGETLRGIPALEALLGARSGRFSIKTHLMPIKAELPHVSLEEQVLPWAACARAIQKLTRGNNIPRICKLGIDIHKIERYIDATPTATRSIIRRLSSGVSPRSLLSEHGVEASLLHDVLADLTARGAIHSVLDAHGDLLPDAVAEEISVVTNGERPAITQATGETPEPPVVFTPSVAIPVIEEKSSTTAQPLLAQASDSLGSEDEIDEKQLPDASEESKQTDGWVLERDDSHPQDPSDFDLIIDRGPLSVEPMFADVPSRASIPVNMAPDSESTSIQIPRNSVSPRPSQVAVEPVNAPLESLRNFAIDAPPLVPEMTPAAYVGTGPVKQSPYEITLPMPLTPRPPFPQGLAEECEPKEAPFGPHAVHEAMALTEKAPEKSPIQAAILASENEGSDSDFHQKSDSPPRLELKVEPTPSKELSWNISVPQPAKTRSKTLQSQGLTPPLSNQDMVDAPLPPIDAPPKSVTLSSAHLRNTFSADPFADSRDSKGTNDEFSVRIEPSVPVSNTTKKAKKQNSSRPMAWLATLCVLGVTGYGLASYQDIFTSKAAPAAAAVADNADENDSALTAEPTGENNTAPVAQPQPTFQATRETTAQPTTPAGIQIEDLPLPDGAHVPDGQGLVEVVAGKRDKLVIDRVELGRGPKVTSTLPQGNHELRAQRKGDELPLTVAVKSGRLTRIDLRRSWKK